MTARYVIAALSAACLASCTKVPLVDVGAEFEVADAVWFDEEDTLFFFWNVEAEQGLGDFSDMEVRYITDTERLDWTAVSELTHVHDHVSVSCGPNARCGSASLRVSSEPREIEMRLRYHRDGDLVLDTPVSFHAVGPGDAHSHRSLLVYGVFDETNSYVQWRARHNFPNLRNTSVEQYGLRRYFSIDGVSYGTGSPVRTDNIYTYGVECPADFEDTGLRRVNTTDRALFHPDPLPAASGAAPTVCADATVFDALGPFTTGALARKNPEVRPAFPTLYSPVQDATPLKFMLGPCSTDPESEAHESMQRQRLQLEDVPTTCTDSGIMTGLAERLQGAFQRAIAAERPYGEDMVLAIAVNHNDPRVAAAVEEALLSIVPAERHRSSPRVAGAFVFDSTQAGLVDDDLATTTLWCPSSGTSEDGDLTCPPQPDTPDVNIGPVHISELPILPDRAQYLDFLDIFSAEQGGGVQTISYRVPSFATTTEHIDTGPFGVMTFLNQESFAASPEDVFSFCAQEQPVPVVFSTPDMRSPGSIASVLESCDAGELPDAVCDTAQTGAVGPEGLAAWHKYSGQDEYQVGIRWDFPFLLRMEYRTVVAGGAALFGLSVPFGAASPHTSYFGADAWLRSSFPLDTTLLQCRRFCDHPTFDSAGVYLPNVTFEQTYTDTCYTPHFPELTDPGFPVDP